MSKHTPGPWKIEPVAAVMSTQQKDFLITYSDGELRSNIARLFDNSLCEEHGTTTANARLIAAAPDLLKTIESIYHRLNGLKNGKTKAESAILEQCLAAIAKAEGK